MRIMVVDLSSKKQNNHYFKNLSPITLLSPCIFYQLHFNFKEILIINFRTINIGIRVQLATTNFKKVIQQGILLAILIIPNISLSNSVPCPDQSCEEALEIISRDITPETITPYISNPIEDEEKIQQSFTQVTNQLKPGSLFYSFVSDVPSPEELRRVEASEKMARSRGFEVTRIVVPINKFHLNAPKNFATKVVSYFGTQKVSLANTPEDIAKLPTPKERAAAKFIPIKNLIVKPLAWSAHAGPVGAAAVTAVSFVYSYFTSTYWHLFRVFFNHPHLIGEGSKLGGFLEKINLAELASKFGLEIKNEKLKEALLSFNGRKVAGIVQYAAKKFAYNLFNAELYKLVSMQGGFFTAEYHMHILTSKLYGLSYYPVTWMEDRLVLTRLIHRDTLAKIMVFQSYVGGAMSSLDLAGGHIPGIDIRPGVILMGYNAASLVAYVLYYKYMSYKLGFKDPAKMKAYIEHKEKLELVVQNKTKEIRDKPWFEGWEERFFYDKASRADSVEEINKIYEKTLELIPEVRRSMSLMHEYLWLGEGFWLKRKLLKVTNFEELDSVNKEIESRLELRQNYNPERNLYSPYKANCFPTLNNLFN